MDIAGLPGRAATRLARGRAMEAALFPSRCTIRRLLPQEQWQRDPVTGRQVKTWATTHVSVPCRIGRGNASRSESSGGVDVELATRVLHLPHDIADLADGDLAEVVSGESAGSVWQMLDTEPADQQTARRVQVTEIRRPSEWI